MILSLSGCLRFSKPKHQKQVEYYQKAITEITGKRTEGMLIYLLEDEIREELENIIPERMKL